MCKAVIDSKGFLVAFVKIVDGKPFEYELKKGESLVNDLGFQGMIKPKWDGTKWIETGTAPPPVEVPKSEIDIKLEYLGQKITQLELIIAQNGGAAFVK